MMPPYLWLLFGIVSVVIFIALIWAKHMRKVIGLIKRESQILHISNKKGITDTSYFSNEKLIKLEVHESFNGEQMGNDVAIYQN